MPQFVEVPPRRLPADVLQALLEEYASRDGTDYGLRELSLRDKTENLHKQLADRDLCLLFEAESEQWDLLPRDQARALLEQESST